MTRNFVYKTGTYKQKVISRFSFDGNITSIAAQKDGTLYICADGGVYKLLSGEWSPVSSDGYFKTVKCDKKDRVLTFSDNSLYKITKSGLCLLSSFEFPISAIFCEKSLYILTDTALYCEENGEFIKVQDTEFPCFAISEKNGRICIANARSVQRLEGKRKTWRCIFPEHSTMPELNINDIAFDGIGYLWVGADEGAYIYDYKSGWYSHKEIPALPGEKVYCVKHREDGSAVLGTNAGAVIVKDGASKYLPAERYAFNTDVTDIAFSDGAIYTASTGGVIRITEKDYTLEEKANYLFTETEKYFPRKDGFVTSIERVIDGDIASAAPSRITDNDGLWTESYLAALCLCYKETGNKKILEAARRSKNAMLLLMKATGIKGFTARAVRYPDEENWGKGLITQDIGEEWHRSEDGTYEWLGETSSDEMTGHYMGLSLYYDMCADKKEKAEICTAICDITDHILDNGGYLNDCDGKPTTWGCWDPNALNNDSMWMWEKGINSLQMLTFLKVSHHMSGDEKYMEKYNDLILNHHFLLNAAFHKKDDGHECHIDDNLGMCISLTLLRLETDPAVRSYLLMGLTSHWNYERVEKNPFYSFVYSAFTERTCDIEDAVQALKDYPLDFINYNICNSNRKNLKMTDEPVRWGGEERIAEPFAWDERDLSRFGTRPFTVDGGNPTTAEGGMSYLLMYWIGRHFGIIE